MRKILTTCLALLLAAALLPAQEDNGALLFYLSGENGTTADFAQGSPYPNYLSNISVLEEGAVGKGIHCADKQLFSYWAPGNIYSNRGTLSFFWKSGQIINETPFPIFRVGFADHSSWDMTWLRIDWNGHGFDAFVTDNNLVRLRVSTTEHPEPTQDQWTHIAFSWDENVGIRLYLDGRLAAKRDTCLTLNTGLDQFGPHSRIISPYQVQSAYNMQRGGDIDEIRIYSRMITDADAVLLAQAETPQIPVEGLSMGDKAFAGGWNHALGFDGASLPPYLENENTTVRKIGIDEVYDLKRWWWKANDGILETTWPGVYNRSRIEGRNDYFQLPDWDCYFDSGWKIRFNMPQEKWNYLEITGGAFGPVGVTPNPDGTGGKAIGQKPAGTQRSFYKLAEPVEGQTVTFTNEVQETPIQEVNAFYVHEGAAPQGVARLSYTLGDFHCYHNPALEEVRDYVAGRFEPEARSMMLALPAAARNAANAQPGHHAARSGQNLPIVHIVIPSNTRELGLNVPVTLDNPARNLGNASWEFMRAGLDGILVELPALDLAPAQGGLIPLNIRVKDPVWKLRDMVDFSFSVRPGQKRNLWIDMRDRILPEGLPLYLTLASGCAQFGPEALAGARITLVFKSYDEARAEHIADRLTQVRDNHAMIVEEHPGSKRLNKFNQIDADMRDLFRVDPENKIGRSYWALYYGEQAAPAYDEPVTPAGVPEWAFTQLELLKEYRHLITWWLDNREIENGEIGGGLSDDSDFANFYPAYHAMGLMPDRFRSSQARLLEAIYDQGMLTDGVSTIMTDGLHTYEEGVNSLDQMNILEPGNPKYAERLMQTAKTYHERFFQVNAAGHTHLVSDFFSHDKIAREGIWAWVTHRSYYHAGPSSLLGQLYGNSFARENVLRFLDSQLAHARVNEQGRYLLPEELNFITDEVRVWGSNSLAMPPLWYAWLWTKDEKYLAPIKAGTWLPSVGTKEEQAQLYRRTLRNLVINDYIYTDGQLWSDRIQYSTSAIQTARLGMPAMDRSAYFMPVNPLSWKFADDEDVTQVAILVSNAAYDHFDVDFFNTKGKTVQVEMIGGQALLGDWELSIGGKTQTLRWGRDRRVTLKIPAGKEYRIEMRLKTPGPAFNELPDLAIGEEDVVVNGGRVEVTLHNLGGVTTNPMKIALVNAKGKVLSENWTPAIAAPLDLVPKTARVVLEVPAGTDLKGCSVVIDPRNEVEEKYESNHKVLL